MFDNVLNTSILLSRQIVEKCQTQRFSEATASSMAKYMEKYIKPSVTVSINRFLLHARIS